MYQLPAAPAQVDLLVSVLGLSSHVSEVSFPVFAQVGQVRQAGPNARSEGQARRVVWQLHGTYKT